MKSKHQPEAGAAKKIKAMDNKTLNYSAILFAGIVLLAILINYLFAPSWKKSNKQLAEMALYDEIVLSSGDFSRIISSNPEVVVVDLSSDSTKIPGLTIQSIHIPVKNLYEKKNIRHLRKAPLKILLAENESTALNAWMMLTSLGVENMKVMGGGKQNLIRSMNQGELDASILFFKDEKARFNYPALMKVSSGQSPQEGAEGQEKEKTELVKVQGGC